MSNESENYQLTDNKLLSYHEQWELIKINNVCLESKKIIITNTLKYLENTLKIKLFRGIYSECYYTFLECLWRNVIDTDNCTQDKVIINSN